VTNMASEFPATPGRITVVEAQRMTGVPGPELMQAIVSGELTWVEGDRHVYMVDLAEVEAWAARRTRG
jgi:hypothetical protein